MSITYSFRMLGLLLICSFLSLQIAAQKSNHRSFYKLTVYHFATMAQESTLDNYLQAALIPALHRAGKPDVGVFKAVANDTAADKLLYVMLPHKDLKELTGLGKILDGDDAYTSAAAEYLAAPYKSPAYSRMETILLQAFELAPRLILPALTSNKAERIYELRSYESATEKMYRTKVKMFNQGDEIGLFKRLGFNAIFYGEVLVGGKMPNLMYMTSFENKADRDAHWNNFKVDPYWKNLSSLPEYQNAVSHIDITFLRPTDYSDY